MYDFNVITNTLNIIEKNIIRNKDDTIIYGYIQSKQYEVDGSIKYVFI